MLVFKDWVAPNFARTTVHRVARVEILPRQGVVRVVVDSYPDDVTENIAWEEVHILDRAALSGEGDPEALALEAMVAAGGPLEGGEIEAASEAGLNTLKARYKILVTSRQAQAEAAGCGAPKGRVQTDPNSRAKILGLIGLANIDPVTDFPLAFKMENNSFEDHSADDMKTMGVSVARHILLCFKRAQILKAAIDAAGTAEDLLAININNGWPDIVPENEE